MCFITFLAIYQGKFGFAVKLHVNYLAEKDSWVFWTLEICWLKRKNPLNQIDWVLYKLSETGIKSRGGKVWIKSWFDEETRSWQLITKVGEKSSLTGRGGRGKRGKGEPEFPVKSQTTHWGQEGVEGEGQNWTWALSFYFWRERFGREKWRGGGSGVYLTQC